MIYVNDLLLVFIELKNSNVNVKNAYDDNLSNYRFDITQLFNFNAFCILTNALETQLETVLDTQEVFGKLGSFKLFADTLLQKDKWRKSFAVYKNTISALFESSKPEIYNQAKKYGSENKVPGSIAKNPFLFSLRALRVPVYSSGQPLNGEQLQ